MALYNGLRYSITLLLFLLLSAASAARLLQNEQQNEIDYTSRQAGREAVNHYNMQHGSNYHFCKVLTATNRINQDGESSEYFVKILAQNPDGTTAVYAAEVTISKDPDAVPIVKYFVYFKPSKNLCT
ncbi:hypothetical protein HPP92_005944 [Vanilla planifolia]|uniref:Cysteine proteinase inhibitor n=1 Tax=Vanilla planifolia TaxID=51239 RepID=A0A835VFC7_VANPL|nr:hypothetical protein HPP92_006229 [Vanilla planifolia]KAG0494950.1 hypothetical protein HPP92_005944 [Vanilla planifolia]